MNPAALLKSPRTPFLLVLVAGLALTTGGVIFSQFLNLAACPLCILQRMVYLSLGLLAVPGLLVAKLPWGRRLVALAMAIGAGTGVFIAGYQVWIQRFSPSTTCGGVMTWWEELVDWAGEQVPLLFQASGLCSDPAWTLFGLSIADWSLGFFTLLLLLSLHTLFRRR